MSRRAAAVVVGGGIGGLAAAIALARGGHGVTILERRIAPSEGAASEEGAGIQIGPNGTRLLVSLGVADVLAPLAASPRAVEVRDGLSGRHIVSLPLGAWIAARHGAPYWTAHRAHLHGALAATAAAMPGVEVVRGVTVTGLDAAGPQVAAVGAEGPRARGELVIAADGRGSRLRSDVAAGADLRFAGKTAARSVLPAAAVSSVAADVVGLWLAPAAHVVHYPVDAGRQIALVVVTSAREHSEAWGAPVAADVMMQGVARLARPVRDLVEAAGDRFRAWSLMDLGRPVPMARGRVALLGDAAHPILPFLAQGAVLAIEDAVVLAGLLHTNTGPVECVLGAYASARRERVEAVARAARRNGAAYHLGGALGAARNAAMALAGGERLMAAYDWLYGWRPPA
ncbi:MAG: FAD-dependent monooxygenase [Hyphomicrobiaceae bacterium]|nr:FAD-dependent monooxygenase [Hyphomicrobiaceae bacterium]